MYLLTAFLLLTGSLTVSAQNPCHKYVLISARGTGEPQGPSVGFVGMVNSTLAALSDGIEYDVVYPASLNFTIQLGGEDINRYINAGLQACPQQQYALLGYSQGASAAAVGLHNLTNNNNTQAINAIKAIVVIGNPGHVAGRRANVDQFGGDTTRNYTGAFYLDGVGAVPDTFYNEDKILDICWQGDTVCAPTYPNPSFIPSHLNYITSLEVQKMGADFLVSKLSGASNNATTSAPTTSAPSTPTASASTPTHTGGAAAGHISGATIILCGIMLAGTLGGVI